MKKHLFAAVLLLTALSCAKEMAPEEPAIPAKAEESKTWTLTVDATKGAGEDTKALALDGNYLSFFWSGSDKVSVYSPNSSGLEKVGTLYPQTTGSNRTRLTGDISGNYYTGEPLILVYPEMPENAMAFTAQKGTVEDISKNHDYAVATVEITSIDTYYPVRILACSDADFESAQSITKFDFSYATASTEGIVRLAVTAYTLYQEEYPVTVVPDEPGTSFYIAIPNCGFDEKIRYTFTAETESGDIYEGTKTAALENGTCYKTTVQLSKYNPLAAPLTLEALEDGIVTIENPFGRSLYYGFEGVNNSAVNSNVKGGDPIEIPVKAGDKLLLGGKLTTGNRYWSTPTQQTQIKCSSPVYLYGNIMSLIDFEYYMRPEQNPFLQTVEEFAFLMLFYQNSNLYNHPEKKLELPATTVKKGAYALMFFNCDNLTEAPELPATTLSGGPYATSAREYWSPYYMMFGYCDRLKKAPGILPATTVPASAYYRMFDGCVALEASPVLPAANPGYHAYRGMFNACFNLKQITCYATSNLGENAATHSWVERVPSTGVFIKHPDASWPVGDHGIPAGWSYDKEPLTLEAIEDGTFTIDNPQHLRITWGKSASMASATTSNQDPIIIPVSAGDKVRLWGDNPVYAGAGGASYLDTHIYGSHPYYAYGDICSLVSSSNYPNVTAMEPFALRELFVSQAFDASYNRIPNPIRMHPSLELTLGATTLGERCYEGMFMDCTALTKTPALPATSLAEGCYAGMFANCTALTQAPALPATTLAPGCYSGMFQGCTALESTPALPATTLAEGCYMNMFDYCTSLTSAPALNAATLVPHCYSYMFRDCTALQAVTCLGTNPRLSDYEVEPPVMGNVDGWLDGTAASGTLTRKAGVSWPAGTVPGGWSIVNQ